MTPGAHCCMFVQCTLMPMKWLVHPESAIACSLCASTLAANAYLDVVLEKAIVFVDNLCLVVLILSLVFHFAGAAANVCVDPFSLFAVVAASWCPAFLLRQRALL